MPKMALRDRPEPYNVRTLCRVAFDEIISWLLGKRRFDGISALDQHRVLHLFATITGEAPSVEEIVNALGIPEARAVAMLSRLRYGEARLLRALVYKSAAREIRERLNGAPISSGRKTIYVSVDKGSCIEEANMTIMTLFAISATVAMLSHCSLVVKISSKLKDSPRRRHCLHYSILLDVLLPEDWGSSLLSSTTGYALVFRGSSVFPLDRSDHSCSPFLPVPCPLLHLW